MTTGSLSPSEPRTVEQNCLVLDCTSSWSCLHTVDTRLKVAALICGWSLVGNEEGGKEEGEREKRRKERRGGKREEGEREEGEREEGEREKRGREKRGRERRGGERRWGERRGREKREREEEEKREKYPTCYKKREMKRKKRGGTGEA